MRLQLTRQGKRGHSDQEDPRYEWYCMSPQVRRNQCVEIVPLSTGCLGACTYCKTKHARGELGSYSIQALDERVRQAAADPLVCQTRMDEPCR